MSARIQLHVSIGDISVASVFPLCSRVYKYLHRNNVVFAVPHVSASIIFRCIQFSRFRSQHNFAGSYCIFFLLISLTVYSTFAYFEGINFCSFVKVAKKAKINTPPKIEL